LSGGADGVATANRCELLAVLPRNLANSFMADDLDVKLGQRKSRRVFHQRKKQRA